MEETIDLREYFGIIKKVLDNYSFNSNSSSYKWCNKLFEVEGNSYNYYKYYYQDESEKNVKIRKGQLHYKLI